MGKRRKQRDEERKEKGEEGRRSKGQSEIRNEPETIFDENEPTMAEKLASLELKEGSPISSPEKEDISLDLKPPSADSIQVLLKQALHADDRTLILECLHTQDEKVISNSVSMLNHFEVLKLLNFLAALIHSRGAVLAGAISWLRSLLLLHASGIMSQESSTRALNSLYQVIESRTATFKSAIQLSNCLDYLFPGVDDDREDDLDAFVPLVYEDNDSVASESLDEMDADVLGQEGVRDEG